MFNGSSGSSYVRHAKLNKTISVHARNNAILCGQISKRFYDEEIIISFTKNCRRTTKKLIKCQF